MNSQELLQLYQSGQTEAATAIFDRYVARLIALARRRIGPKLQRRVDAEDVVQSAYRSFFIHAKDGEYQLAESGDLWRLLAGITLHKLGRQIERQTAAKRSVAREEPADLAAANVAAPEPSAAEVIAVVEELQLAIRNLSPDERQALTANLQGQSIEEISGVIGKSGRTVRRILASAKRQLEQRLLSGGGAGQRSRPVLVGGRPMVETEAPLRYADYVLEQLIGAGGMGKVFRARDKRAGGQVAIKTLHRSRQSDERAVARFVQESQILAGLRHPNIVAVHGLGQFPGGGYFLAMDFIDGLDLHSRLLPRPLGEGRGEGFQQGPLPLDEIIAIAKQIATAMQYAHDRGIVHCDLKPANVILDKDGRAIVTDFGFATLIAASSPATATSIGGTAGYIAPEILGGRTAPTPAADIFALGQLVIALATGDPPPATSANPLPAALGPLAPICRRCLAPNPLDRYNSMNELIRDLDSIGSTQ